MKKMKLQMLGLSVNDLLSREQMKKVMAVVVLAVAAQPTYAELLLHKQMVLLFSKIELTIQVSGVVVLKVVMPLLLPTHNKLNTVDQHTMIAVVMDGDISDFLN